jgi:hypothetical protein
LLTSIVGAHIDGVGRVRVKSISAPGLRVTSLSLSLSLSSHKLLVARGHVWLHLRLLLADPSTVVCLDLCTVQAHDLVLLGQSIVADAS